jgi:hypothetical protein
MMTPNELLDVLAARNITLYVAGNRLKVSDWTALSPDEQTAFRAHRQELKHLVALGSPTRQGRQGLPLAAAALGCQPEPSVGQPGSPPPEPMPLVWDVSYSRRITDADVAAAGIAPDMPRQQAFERARKWLADKVATEQMYAGLRRRYEAR